jgi:uncharacterized membrane protein YfcA
MPFPVAVAAVAMLAGGIASVSGFGIGSLLTPLLALEFEMKTAVAAVSIPHFVATLLRFWKLRSDVDRSVLARFGVVNALGAFIGALLHTRVNSSILTIILGVLLMFAGVIGVTGLTDRMRLGPRASWVAGLASGAFGGLVGNQGGIRSAAMLGLGLEGAAFVATATAIALAVDAARIPFYLAAESPQIVRALPLLVPATGGVVVGTLAGERLLRRIPETIFRRVVSAILLGVGAFLLLANKTLTAS